MALLPVDVPEEKIRKAGVVYDLTGRYIGRYVYLTYGDEQHLLDLLNAWIHTSKNDKRFFNVTDLETGNLDPRYAPILLYSISPDGENAVVFSPHLIDFKKVRDKLIEYYQTVPICNQNLKFDLRFLYWHLDKVKCNVFLDTLTGVMIGWNSAWPRRTMDLGTLCDELLNYKISKDVREGFIGRSLDDLKFTNLEIEYAARDSLLTYCLAYPIMKRLHNMELMHILELDQSLMYSLIETELAGIPVDVPYVREMLGKVEEELLDMMEVIQPLYLSNPNKLYLNKKGIFNPGSPPQVVKVLSAEGIRVKCADKEALADAHLRFPDNVMLGEIIRYRMTLTTYKMFRTYLEGSGQGLKRKPPAIDLKTSCFHPSFVITVNTGRLAVRDPNVMAIDKKYRALIHAREGRTLVWQDMSQFEFRACAAISGEPALMSAYIERAELLPKVLTLANQHGFIDADTFAKKHEKGELDLTGEDANTIVKFLHTDIHRRNIAGVLGIPVDKVGSQEREIGKCLGLDTLVHLEDRIVPVGSLLPNNPKSGKYYPLEGVRVLTDIGFKDASEIYYDGSKPALCIRTLAGRTLTVSPKHRFRSSTKKEGYVWLKASQLKEGSELFVKTINPQKVGAVLNKDYPEAFLAAAHLTNTMVQKEKGRFSFGKNIEALIAAKEAQKQIGCKARAIRNGLSSPNLGAWISINCSSCTTDHVPFKFMENPDGDETLAFLQCLCYLSGKRGTIRLRSDNTAKDVQNLLLRRGIISWKTGNTLTIHGKNLELFCGVEQHVFNPRPDLRRPDPLVEKSFGSVTIEEIKQNLTKEEFELCQMLTDEGIHRDVVVSVTKVEKRPLCDLVVPENHTVVYDGLITHNTLGYCVSSDTLILTRRLDWVPAGDLKIGDGILGFDEDSNPNFTSGHGRSTARRWRKGLVENTGRSYLPSYKLTFTDGSTFTCSENHQLIIASRKPRSCWVKAKHLRVGAKLSYYIDPWEPLDTYEAGWLSGIFDGEGWFLTNHIGICQKGGEILEKIKFLLWKFGIDHSMYLDPVSGVYTATFKGTLRDRLSFLGKFKPERLISNLNIDGIIFQKKSTKTISKIDFLGLQEMVTLQTSTKTFISDGLGSHNSALYGAAEYTIFAKLYMQRIPVTLEECRTFLQKFYTTYRKVDAYVHECHRRVVNKSPLGDYYVETVLGRKRFFRLCPPWQTARYRAEKAAAEREASNSPYQGGNSDALKQADILIYEDFQQFPEEHRPLRILLVHDELVHEVWEKEDNVQRVVEIGEKHMVATGFEAVNCKLPMEISTSVGAAWSKD